MSSMQARSKTGCLSCKNRRKKCDEARPVCNRCTRARVECLGYSYLDDPQRTVRRRRTKVVSSTSSGWSANDTDTNSRSSPLPSNLGMGWDDTRRVAVPGVTTQSIDLFPEPHHYVAKAVPQDALDFSFMSDSVLFSPSNNQTTSSCPNSNFTAPSTSITHSFATPHTLPSISLSQPSEDLLLRPPEYVNSNPSLHHAPVTSPVGDIAYTGFQQTDLLGTWLDLDGFPDEDLGSHRSTSQIISSAYTSTCPSPDTGQNDDSEASEGSDVESARDIIRRMPALDNNVPSNSLPFILQSYSNWITLIAFEPVKIAQHAKDLLLKRYVSSGATRYFTTLKANVVRALVKNPASAVNYLPAIPLLRDYVGRSLASVRSSRDPINDESAREALEALDSMMEILTIQSMSSSLSSTLALIQEAAPVYRRACPIPPGEPIHLQSMLLLPQLSLRHFPTMDILYSVRTSRPMHFRYDVSYDTELGRDIFKIGGFGMHWMQGVPDHFIMMLARMNILRDEVVPNVDPNVIDNLATEIKDFRPDASATSNPLLNVARVVVQESWRQAMYVYLYMGLCGADTSDVRVKNVVKCFIKLLKSINPGRIPDTYLILPMIIVGVATRQKSDRNTIRHRMLTLNECSQPGTCEFDSFQAMNVVWAQSDFQERPATWIDLGSAVTKVMGQ